MTLLLAFDTATPQVGVAVYDGHQVVAELVSDRAMKHGEQLAPLIASALERSGVTRSDLTGIAVGAGPGPFTGLRVGLVTARTLGFVLRVPVRAVCTLDVIAAEVAGGLDTPPRGRSGYSTGVQGAETVGPATGVQGAETVGPATGVEGPAFAVATDARRKEVYLATYDAAGRRLGGPVVERPDQVATDSPVAGEGPLIYPDAFPRPIGPTRPSAGWLARVVADERAELLEPEPLYLRRPDAEARYGSRS